MSLMPSHVLHKSTAPLLVMCFDIMYSRRGTASPTKPMTWNNPPRRRGAPEQILYTAQQQIKQKNTVARILPPRTGAHAPPTQPSLQGMCVWGAHRIPAPPKTKSNSQRKKPDRDTTNRHATVWARSRLLKDKRHSPRTPEQRQQGQRFRV